MARRFTPRSAFTLIELLVVISLIALLIAILLPVLGNARESAIVSLCLSNQRQMGIALTAYDVDNGDYPDATPFPVTATNLFAQFDRGGASSRAWLLPQLVKEGYLATEQVGFCPQTWELDFTYEAGPPPAPAGLSHRRFVGNTPQQWTGWITSQLGYAGTGGAHRGEYLYTGPGAHTWVWQKPFVSTAMLEEVLDIPVAGSNWWVFGVHSDGRVGSAGNPFETNAQFTGRSRLPLMGEGAENVGGAGGIGRATHFGQDRLTVDTTGNGGLQNYLFTDGSAESFRYGR